MKITKTHNIIKAEYHLRGKDSPLFVMFVKKALFYKVDDIKEFMDICEDISDKIILKGVAIYGCNIQVVLKKEIY